MDIKLWDLLWIVLHPGYFWTTGTTIVSRYKAQKKVLAGWLTTFDENKTERANMFEAKYRLFWNCGNYVFVWKK